MMFYLVAFVSLVLVIAVLAALPFYGNFGVGVAGLLSGIILASTLTDYLKSVRAEHPAYIVDPHHGYVYACVFALLYLGYAYAVEPLRLRRQRVKSTAQQDTDDRD